MIQQPVQDTGRVAVPDVDDFAADERIFLRDVGVDLPSGSNPYFKCTCPVESVWLPALNRCPSEGEVVPSPQCVPIGCAYWVLTSSAGGIVGFISDVGGLRAVQLAVGDAGA